MMRAPVHDLHVSNLLTYAGLAAAVAACLLALDERTRPLAAAAIALAATTDTFDGAFARLFARTPRQARCGMEIDSLVDAIAFGAAPLVVLFAAGLSESIPAAYQLIGGVVYALAAITRLGFYNVEQDTAMFIGAPTPAAALLCLTALLLPGSSSPTVALVVAAALMVAPIRIARPRGVARAMFCVWSIALIVVHAGRYYAATSR
jgi:CDP-diacylglycerol---serine O-phosphatidyltransferase